MLLPSIPATAMTPCQQAAAAEAIPHPRGSRRWRLWELPASTHELLLGLSLAPECLRATVARAIGQQRAVRCVIEGSEVEVFFSVLHDLRNRNVVSEAVHKACSSARRQACQAFAFAFAFALALALAQATGGHGSDSCSTA